MSRTINLLLSILFVIIGFFMAFIGATVLADGPSNETEWTIGIMGMGSAILLFYGAYKTIKGQNKQDEAERQESVRLAKRYASAPPKARKSEAVEVPSGEPSKEHEVELLEPNLLPEILVRWTYTPTAWRLILLKLAEKTRKEEFYTAFWFPVLFAIVFFSHWYYGVILGIILGWLYIRFRVYFIKQKFALKPRQQEAEVIISDSYIRVNNNFINYADGKYFLKQLNLEQDEKLGEMLHFTIGWVTSKGYPAEMDLYLPIPIGHLEEAESVLSAFKAARS